MDEPKKGEQWAHETSHSGVTCIGRVEGRTASIFESDAGDLLVVCDRDLREWHRVEPEPVTCTCGRLRWNAAQGRWEDGKAGAVWYVEDRDQSIDLACSDCHDRLDEGVAVPMMPRPSEEDLEALARLRGYLSVWGTGREAVERLLAAARREVAP